MILARPTAVPMLLSASLPLAACVFLVACGGGGGSGDSVATTAPLSAVEYPTINTMNALGQSIVIRPVAKEAGEGYDYQTNDPLGSGSGGGYGVGGGYSRLPISSPSAGVTRITDYSGVDISFTRATDSFILAWSAPRTGTPPVTGLGIDMTVPVTLVDLAATYNLIGQRCLQQLPAPQCVIEVATARLRADGTMRICPSADYSDTCAGAESFSLTVPTSGNSNVYGQIKPSGLWTMTEQLPNRRARGYELIGSRVRGAIALSYGTYHFDANSQYVFDGVHTLFGHRQDLTASTAVSSAPLLTFSKDGHLLNVPPAAATWGVVPNTPLSGYFQDAAGNTYLHSTPGQLITWTVGGGLQLFSKP